MSLPSSTLLESLPKVTSLEIVKTQLQNHQIQMKTDEKNIEREFNEWIYSEITNVIDKFKNSMYINSLTIDLLTCSFFINNKNKEDKFYFSTPTTSSTLKTLYYVDAAVECFKKSFVDAEVKLIDRYHPIIKIALTRFDQDYLSETGETYPFMTLRSCKDTIIQEIIQAGIEAKEKHLIS
jgi:hypothetical protein